MFVRYSLVVLSARTPLCNYDMQEVSDLALHIVREMYGEQVERVCQVLLRNGPSTMVDIISYLGANVDHNQVCKFLCILVQQNLLVVHLKEDKVTGIYEVCIPTKLFQLFPCLSTNLSSSAHQGNSRFALI